MRRAPPHSFDFASLPLVPTRCLGCGAPSEHRGADIEGRAVLGHYCPSCGGYIVVDTDPARWVDVVDEGDEEEQS